MANKIVSLSLAQYRLLGRAIRGDRLPMSRYRPEHATVAALYKKSCLFPHPNGWEATEHGRKIFACRGALRPGETVWDSASNEERAAYYRTLRYQHKSDMEIVGRLRDRMRAAGELREDEATGSPS